MPIELLLTLDVIEALENYLDRIRPSEELREQVDVAYKIEDQSIIIYEIRPFWKNPKEKIESPIAKTTFIKSKNHWKIFWQRADLKWHSYQPKPTVKSIKEFVETIEADSHGCFWG